MLCADLQRFGQPCGAVIRRAIARLSLAGSLGVGRQRLFQRRLRIVHVRYEVKVTVCKRRSESSAARGYKLSRSFLPRPHFHADFGGDDDLLALAAAFEPMADDRLRFAAAVARRPARIDIRRSINSTRQRPRIEQ